jgi:tetratricopeptide (TPR) repeat protein
MQLAFVTRWVPWLYVLVGVAAGCTGAAPLARQAVVLNQNGAQALAEGDLEAADARFSLALEYHPDFVEALTNLAAVELQRGNFERARQLLGKATRLNPDVAHPHHLLGLLGEREHRPDRAAEHYREALRVDPGFAPARINLGRILFNAGLYEHALVQYQRLMAIAPGLAEAHSGLAETLARLSRWAEAESVIEQARERFPDHPLVTLLAARRALRHGEGSAARALLTPLTEARDDVGVAALGWLAVTELSEGRNLEAVQASRRALELEPRASVPTYALAVALRRLGDPKAARWEARARELSGALLPELGAAP